MYNFEPYNVLLAIATNITVLLMTAFVLQGHNYILIIKLYYLISVLDTFMHSTNCKSQIKYYYSCFIYNLRYLRFTILATI